MPEIYVHAVKGRSLDQKRALIKDITDAVVRHFNAPIDAVTVEIVEAEPTAKANLDHAGIGRFIAKGDEHRRRGHLEEAG